MIRRKLSIPELKKIVKTSIQNKVLSIDLFINELAWDEEYSRYCNVDYREREEEIQGVFCCIFYMQTNQLYRLSQVFCISGDYFLFLEDDGNIHIHEDNLNEHESIHAVASNAKLSDDIFVYAAL